MPSFIYKAVTADGEVIEGETEAATRKALIDRLRSQGYIPIRAKERTGAGAGGLRLPDLFQPRRVKRTDLMVITRELATLLHAGLPLDRAFSIMLDLGSSTPVGALVEAIRDQVRGGVTLADAMQGHPDIFPRYYVGMVRAGEAGGTLETVLGRLATTLESNQKLRETVREGLRYPALVIIMAGISLVVLMTAVIPEFRPLFEGAGAAMPASTRMVIGVSDFLSDYWWLMAVLIVLAGLALRQHNRTPAGRLRWDRWTIRAAVIGDLITKVEVARFSRTLGTLLGNGVNVLSAISMTVDTLDNRAVAEVVARAQGRLAKGEGLAEPMMESGIIPGLAIQLIRVGEETGQLDTMLLRIADIYDEEVKRGLQRMLSLLVPFVTLGLGVLIAVIIGSMMAAILSSYDLPL